MGIVRPQTTKVKISRKTIHKYEHIGLTGLQADDIVEIPVDELANCSQVKVNAICDFCGKSILKCWKTLLRNEKECKPILCKECINKVISEQRIASWFDGTEKKPLYHDKDWLEFEYKTKNRTAKNIAIECGVSVSKIEKYLNKFGISKHCDVEQVISKELLFDLHINQGLSVRMIAKRYSGIGEGTILDLFDKYGIQRLSATELRQRWWSNPDNNAVMSEKRRLAWQNDDYREKVIDSRSTEDVIQKMRIGISAHHQGIPVSEWTDFKTDESRRIRTTSEYVEWRTRVFERDNYTCQCCGARSKSGNPVKLNAHHIDSFSKHKGARFDVSNGITLCDECHDPRKAGSLHNVYGTQDVTREQLMDYIDSRNR